MFDATVVERTFDRESWTKLYRIMRKVGDRGSLVDESALGSRGRLAEHVASVAVDGMVSFNESGMDCDCVRGESSRTIPVSPLRAIEARIDDIYEWAEGPTSVWIDTPENGIESSSRDLIMEAHENGHPHFVSEAASW
jgi:hypothetical protein